MTRSRPTPLAPLDIAPRLGRAARAARRRRSSTRCSSPSSRTSATSPASPVRPASLLVTRRRRAVRHRRPLHRAVDGAARRAPASTARDRDRPHRGRADASCSSAAVARRCPARARGAQRHLGRSSATSPPRSQGVELVPAGDARRGPAPGEGRGRDRPHPRARARSPTTRSRRCCRGSADGITEREFALALEFAMRERGASGNSFDPIIASGPERREAAPRARAIA